VEPVSSAVYGRFLFRWQHASGPRRGEAALLDVIEQLQGFEAAAGAWESEILPLRIAGYDQVALDGVCLSGDVVWGRFNGRPVNGEGQANKAVLSRTIPISLGVREALLWLVGANGANVPPGAATEVLGHLAGHGATFLPEIASGTRRMPSEVETGLWQLAATGLVTSDGFGAVRALVTGARKRAQRSSRHRRRGRIWRPASRWALLHPNGGLTHSDIQADASQPANPTVRPELVEGHPRTLPDEVLQDRAMQLLQRYGVVFPEVLARDALAPAGETSSAYTAAPRPEARSEAAGSSPAT
jgi:ATP-dependent Lhr-like helicase